MDIGDCRFARNESRAFLLTPAEESPVRTEDNVLLGIPGDSQEGANGQQFYRFVPLPAE